MEVLPIYQLNHSLAWIPYGDKDDLLKTRQTLQKLIDEASRILKDPASAILVLELPDSSVHFAVRIWCNAAAYWGIYFDLQEKVKLSFDKENISFPFSQRDLHVFNN